MIVLSGENKSKVPKRERGDGCIYKRKDDTWTARIQIGTKADGKPKIKAFYGKSEAEVKRKLKAFKQDIRNLSSADIKKVTLEVYILNWLNSYKINTLKSSSFDRLERTVQNQIIPELGYLQIATIVPDDIQRFLNKLYRDENSHSVVKKAYNALNGCMEHAVIKGDIVKNPMLGVNMIPESKFHTRQISFLTEDEVKLLKQELNRTYKNGKPIYVYADAYILILNTGLRMGEALGLKWSDINFEDRTVHIQRNISMIVNRSREDGEPKYILKIEESVKTKSGNRVVPLNSNAILALNNLKKNNMGEFVITNTQGKIVPPHNFERTFKRALSNCGIEKDGGVHMLRHTFATLLLRRQSGDMDIKTLSKILGHRDTAITYNTYIHVIGEQKRCLVDKLDNI